MDNFIQSKLRFSRTQITKRPFTVATTAGTCSGDQHGNSKTGETKKVPESKAVPRAAKHRAATPVIEHRAVTPVIERRAVNPAAEPRAVTPVAQDTHADEAYTPSPKDVSVTFLASTPKPGRPQLARRRPFVALREDSGETSINIVRGDKTTETGSSMTMLAVQAANNTQKRKQPEDESLTKKSLIEIRQGTRSLSSVNKLDGATKSSQQMSVSATNSTTGTTCLKSGREGVETRSKLKNVEVEIASTSSTVAPNTGSSRNQKNLSSNHSQVRPVQPVSERSVKVSKSVTGSKGGASKRGGSSVMDNTEQSMLPPKLKGFKRKGMETDSSDNVSELRVDCSQTPGKTGKRKRTNGHARLQTDNATRNKPCNKVSSNVVTKTKSTNGERAAGSNTGRKEIKKTIDGPGCINGQHSQQDEVFTMVQVGGQKRKQSYITDLDVVLSNVKLQVSLLNGDSDEEEGLEGAALSLFERYVITDISHQINAMAKVQTLASRISKAGQSVKHLQNRLLELQTRRIGLESDLKPRLGQREQTASNCRQTNNYLRDLKTFINTC